MIGLRVADEIGAHRMVALSPILELLPHLRMHADVDPEFKTWAEKRFGAEFASASIGDLGARQSRVPVTVIAPSNDEVVDPAATSEVIASMNWTAIDVPGSHYPRCSEDALVRWTELVATIVHPARKG